MPLYAELHCLSNFSFQRGASSADELFERAAALGYAALAITDECSFAGSVRAWEASKATGIALIVGTEVRLADGPKLVLLAADQNGYSELCRLITIGRRRCAKGEYRLLCSDVEALGPSVLVLWVPQFSAGLPKAQQKRNDNNDDVHAEWLATHFGERAWIAVELHHGPDDAAVITRLRALGERHALPLVAAGDVHMHVRRRRALQDALTAIGLNCTIAEAGRRLFPNGERHLRRVDALAVLYPPDLIAETLRIAARCTFTFDGLNYQYPHELVPQGHTQTTYLRELTFAGADKRWPLGFDEAIRVQLEKELALIASFKFEQFFLTVHDIVAWARDQTPPILCQGRGSSANSAVCYCLGITAVDPAHGNLLFERFLSKERKEPPDIDVDFEHERREEVIQYVFNKYGRERAALAASVIRYRRKSAVRDIARVLDLADDQIDQLNRAYALAHDEATLGVALRERGFDPASRVIRQLVALVKELRGFPRHLSQHVGGFVISEHPLHHLVPIE
ncbi:MAG: PHP domain-containing protein, partial [Dokdonella sp.]